MYHMTLQFPSGLRILLVFSAFLHSHRSHQSHFQPQRADVFYQKAHRILPTMAPNGRQTRLVLVGEHGVFSNKKKIFSSVGGD